MAARGRRPGRFYVYAIHDGDGLPVYIGKGTGRRLKNQCRAFGRPGYLLRRFGTEDAAFAYEKKLLAEYRTELNRCAGGGGSRVTTRLPRKPRWVGEMERVGTRVYTARALLKFDLSGFVPPETIAMLRQVASSV